MSLDTAKLLTAEEIENRLYNTEIKILELRKIKNQIARGVAAEFYRLNPVIEEDIKYPLQQRKKISSQLKKLKTNLKAYQTALEAVPEDYN